MDPFRVFVSYSHEDRELAELVTEILKKKGLIPIWDKNIRPGTAFTGAIKGLIAHAHIFMPLITENSRQRPWVHQETGYAMALNIPVLPVAVGNLPGEMIAELQAINVLEPDLSDLEGKLSAINLNHVVIPPPARPGSIVEVADWPEKRVEMMAQYANRVIELGYCGRVRQRGGLSSFSIPDKEIDDPIWSIRDGANRRSDYYHYCLRQERLSLERHARHCGCDLLIDPTVETTGKFPEARKVRLESLLEFLESIPDDQVRVVCSLRARDANITLVGDWFIAESRLRHPVEGWRQTIFNWHSPTVLQWVHQFDQLFDSMLREYSPGPNSSRQKAIKILQRAIESLDKEICGKPDVNSRY